MSIEKCNKFRWRTYHHIRKKRQSNKLHARKSLHFNGQHVWIKKEGGLFDVSMGLFDGTEICEAVGNFLRYLTSKIIIKEMLVSYRDDIQKYPLK